MSRMPTPLYRQIASTLDAAIRCEKAGHEWGEKHRSTLETLVDYLPSGSGIDSGVQLDDTSKPERLVFTFSYHHMNESGMYDGWTDHTVVVTPSLVSGYDMRITGRNRNDIKDYLSDTFGHALSSEVWQEETAPGEFVWRSELYGHNPTAV